jgi:hypothetical protein
LKTQLVHISAWVCCLRHTGALSSAIWWSREVWKGSSNTLASRVTGLYTVWPNLQPKSPHCANSKLRFSGRWKCWLWSSGLL